MPLVRIDLRKGTAPEYREAITDVIYTALTEVANVPAGDKFLVIAEHAPANLVMDPHYVVDRTEQALIIQITLNAGRTVEVKKQLYQAIANGLQQRLALRTEDVFINFVEVAKENWSFGRGEAQFAD